jgi:hypothetical protein
MDFVHPTIYCQPFFRNFGVDENLESCFMQRWANLYGNIVIYPQLAGKTIMFAHLLIAQLHDIGQRWWRQCALDHLDTATPAAAATTAGGNDINACIPRCL